MQLAIDRRFGRFFLVAVVAGSALAGVVEAQSAGRPGFTAAQAMRGAKLYADNCANCHGDNLDDGEFAPGLKGQPFTAYWQGKMASDVLTYIDTMMPPTDPGGLGPQAGADVYAYMVKAGGGAAGAKELPSDPAALGSAAP